MKNKNTFWRKYFRYVLILFPRILRQICFHCTYLIKSDELYIKLIYFLTFGKWLDFQNLETFNEKIQWLKLRNNTALHTKMVDKFGVREIIRQKIGEEYLFPLLGVWEKFDDIDFNRLPEQFVLKPTHDSGNIVFCRNKKTFARKKTKHKLEKALARNYFYLGREYPYKNVPPQIIAEPIMTDESGTELKDYKVFCFDGEVKLIQVDFDRFINHRRNLYTPQWELIDAFILYPHDHKRVIPKPAVLPEMLTIAAKLSKGFPHIRVDFYVIKDKLYFGEFTFHHEGGLARIRPKEFNKVLGSYINLPKK